MLTVQFWKYLKHSCISKLHSCISCTPNFQAWFCSLKVFSPSTPYESSGLVYKPHPQFLVKTSAKKCGLYMSVYCNWNQKIPLKTKLDAAYGPVQFRLSSEFFSSNCFQTACNPIMYFLILGYWMINIQEIEKHEPCEFSQTFTRVSITQ